MRYLELTLFPIAANSHSVENDFSTDSGARRAAMEYTCSNCGFASFSKLIYQADEILCVLKGYPSKRISERFRARKGIPPGFHLLMQWSWSIFSSHQSLVNTSHIFQTGTWKKGRSDQWNDQHWAINLGSSMVNRENYGLLSITWRERQWFWGNLSAAISVDSRTCAGRTCLVSP